ncbi:MAG TPA: hypothetical protein VGE01_14935 [Fimbriimonas sp.]
MRLPAALLIAALAACAFSQPEPKNMTFGTRLKSVSVFRDGFGYFVREGRVKLENGWATTDLMPAAIKGSVWFYTTDKGDRIDTVVMSRENKIEFASAAELKQRLGDKIGLRLTVVTKGGQRHEGELAKILDDMLLLKVGDAFIAVPYEQVRDVLFAGYPVRIKVDTKDPGKTTTLGVAYLQEGIRWEPSYVLDVHRTQADLSLRASMLNTTEKLTGTDVFFVVGSPFVANRGVQDMLAQLPAAAATEKVEAPAPARPMPESAPAITRAALTRDEAGELYYYRKPDLTMATNDIAMVTVFQTVVPVKPSFEWDADGDDVSYLLTLTNKTGQPLTTGPVLVLEDGKAVGQESVKYTAAGADTEIRIARGIGLKVERSEAEVKRGGPTQIGKTNYVPVTLRGTLKVTNHRPDAAQLKITKTVRGKVGELSDKGTVKQTQILNGEPNPINDLEWTLAIAPGATETITYSFETYMSAERAGSPPVPATPDGE